MRSRNWDRLLTGLLLAPIPLVARAETYLTEDQAVAVLFPNQSFTAHTMDLSPEEARQIQRSSGLKGLSRQIRIFWGPHREAVIIDKVLGKHEFITYAVAINADSSVKGIEILDYRETYGSQIRDKVWRDRFSGKTIHDPIQLEKDIPSISGATLSSKHVTDGVRRTLHAYEILKAKA